MSETDVFGLAGQYIEGGKIYVKNVIGEGGFSVVYHGIRIQQRQAVAIKVLKIPSNLTPQQRAGFLEQFQNEAKQLNELSRYSSGVVQAYDSGELITSTGQRVPFMLLEWLDGLPLDRITTTPSTGQTIPPSSGYVERGSGLTRIVYPGQNGGWPLMWVLALLESSIDGLRKAHQRGIAHRDIKPSNIFLIRDATGAPTSKILDFGIAKFFENNEQAYQRTTFGFNAFTAEYAAPEQFKVITQEHGASGPWSDVYSLALLMSELLTGSGPPEGWGLLEYYQRAINPRRPTPGHLGLPLTPALEHVFSKALAVDPRARYQNADLFWRALCAAANYHGRDDLLQSQLTSFFSPYLVVPDISEGKETLPTPIVTPPQPLPSGGLPLEVKSTSSVTSTLLALGLLVGFVTVVLLIRLRPSSSLNAMHRPDAPSSSASSREIEEKPSPSSPSIEKNGTTAGGTRVASECLEGMIFIPGGKFPMGSDEDYPAQNVAGLSTPRENLGWKPAHPVEISPFCIDRYEVTPSRYRKCVEAHRCTIPGTSDAPSERTYHGGEERQDHPVTHVTFAQARAFCQWIGGDLPSEAQWEFAARGTDGRIYPWGNGPAGRLLTCKDVWPKSEKGLASERLASAFGENSKCFPGVKPSAHGPWRVGMAKAGASPFGVEDMAGNVMEWTRDCLDPQFYSKLAEGGVARDPVNENDQCPEVVVRGGGWSHGGGDGNKLPAWNMRAYWREPMIRESTSESVNYDAEIGFRCVK